MRKQPKNSDEIIISRAIVKDVKIEISRENQPITTVVLHAMDSPNYEQIQRMIERKEKVYLVFEGAFFEDYEEEKPQ